MEVWVDSTGPEPEYGTTVTGNPHIDTAGGITQYIHTPIIPDITGLLDYGSMDDIDVPAVPYVDDFSSGIIYGTPYDPNEDPWAFEDRRGGRR